MIGNLIFFALHVVAIIFGFFGLFITIPLHLIYALMRSSRKRTERKIKKELKKHIQ